MTDGAPARQLAFDLTAERPHSRDDLVVSPANAQAVALIDRWPDWPSPVALITGPEGSGKTHLAALWAARARAERRPSAAIGALPEDCRALLVDPLEPGLDEHGLFHAINALRARGGHVLLTAARPPAAMGLALPDLASRLGAATHAAIGAPDDALLAGIIAKLFADRQIAVEADVIAYAASRMERSHSAARRLVDRLDADALARGTAVTKPLVAQALRDFEAGAQPHLFD